MGKQIIIVNQSTGELCRDIANSFIDAEYTVVIISGYKTLKDLKKTTDKSVVLDPIISYNKSSSLKRCITWVLGFLQILYKCCFKYRNGMLFLVSNPPFATLTPLFCRKEYSLLIYDIFPDVLVTQKVLKEDSFIVLLWKKFNKKVFARAKYIFTIGNNMKKCLTQYTDESKITVIQNWADTSFIKPVPKEENPFVIQQHLEDKFVVLYSGNIGNTHKVEVLLDVAKELLDEPLIQFVIIGDGGKKRMLERIVERDKLANCTLLPYQPYESLPFTLTCADIGVITLDESASAMSVPSKTYSMFAAGTVILGIASEKTDFAQLIHRYDVGRCFASSQINDMKRFILDLYHNKLKLDSFKTNARKAAFDFTPENAKLYVKQYLQGDN